jgi:predicted anti-sigma-YlaC factor YlaD
MTRGSTDCKRVRILLGAFVLGGLRGQEEHMVRTHLARCAMCSAECDELAEVPALLDLLTSEEAAQAGDFPGTLVPSQQRRESPQ